MFLTCRRTIKSCKNVAVPESIGELLQVFLRLAAKLGSLCNVRPNTTLQGIQEQGESSEGFLFGPLCLRGVQAKST